MYDQHYGLTGRPFQLTPDPRFWFDTATHKKAMAYLGYGLSQGEGFIVITGDIGAGKTTLVGHLVDTVDASRLNVIRIVSTQIAADDLLRTVCAGLDVDANGLTKAEMLSSIERGLHLVARGGRRTLLVVDEAQALPVDSLEELRMLSNFQAGGHALLQIFLLGQPEFREKLADDALEQLRQRVIAMHHLGPMEADELAPYLIHRLSVVGWQGRPDFAADALTTIYAWSGGIPRRINQLVSRVMLHGAIEGIDSFAAADVMTVVGDLDGDGMTGGATPTSDHDGEPELDFSDPPVAIEAEAEETIEATLPIVADHSVDAPAEEPTVMEWPFTRDPAPALEEDEVAAEWRPIAIEEPQAESAPEAETETETRPIVLEPPAPVVEPLWIASDDLAHPVETGPRPVAIAAPPRLFERFTLRGRKPMLVAVDSVPVVEEPVAEVSEPTPAADIDIAQRLADIDKRLEDQDAALRRVLTLLVDWVEGGARSDMTGLRDRVG